MAMAAMMPMIATVTISSMSEKPRVRRGVAIPILKFLLGVGLVGARKRTELHAGRWRKRASLLGHQRRHVRSGVGGWSMEYQAHRVTDVHVAQGLVGRAVHSHQIAAPIHHNGRI